MNLALSGFYNELWVEDKIFYLKEPDSGGLCISNIWDWIGSFL